jgi:hypothetical protein
MPLKGDASSHSLEVTHQATYKEEFNMPDQDLGGNDLKYVRYSIVFTKRDYEATLQREREEIIDYPTNGGSYGGLKIAEFFGRVAAGEVDRPEPWVTKNYPPGAAGRRGWEIPEEDRRYVTFIYEVDQRLPRGEADYQKRQAEALESISRQFRLSR